MAAGEKDALMNVELMGELGTHYREQLRSRATSSASPRLRTRYPALLHSMECAALLENDCLS